MSPVAEPDEGRLDRLDGDLVAVRERLARLETRAEAHDKASADRHREVLAALESMGERLDTLEGRAWKLGLALLGVGGGAGAVQVAQSLLGG